MPVQGSNAPVLVMLRLLASARPAAHVPAPGWASSSVHEALLRYLTPVVPAAAYLDLYETKHGHPRQGEHHAVPSAGSGNGGTAGTSSASSDVNGSMTAVGRRSHRRLRTLAEL